MKVLSGKEAENQMAPRKKILPISLSRCACHRMIAQRRDDLLIFVVGFELLVLLAVRKVVVNQSERMN